MHARSDELRVEALFAENRFGLRFGLVLAVGIATSLFLTWFMYVLIQSSEMNLDESARVHMLDFVRLKRDEASQRQERKPERPQAEEAPPVPAAPRTDSSSSDMVALGIAEMPIATELNVNADGFSFGAGEGEYLPIVKVAPLYPASASSRRIEGYCVVEYTVTTNGSTRDVQVVEDWCTYSAFQRPSVEAAEKFKYKPRIINGEPVEVTGVRNMFNYVLDKADTGGG